MSNRQRQAPEAKPTLGRSFATLAVGQAVSRLLLLVVTVHLTRELQAERFGIVCLATSLLLYAGLVVDLGFEILGPREVAQGSVPLPTLAGTVLALRLALATVVLGAAACFAWLAPISDLSRAVVLLYGLSLLTNALDPSWAFLGAERMRPPVLADIVCQGGMAIGTFLFVQGPEGLLWVPLIFFCARLLAVSGLLVAFARAWGVPLLRLDARLIRRLLPAALPLCGSSAVALISANFDLVLLGLWLGAGAAGIYGAAYRLVWVPIMIATAYQVALRPSVCRASLVGPDHVEAVMSSSMRIAAAVSFGIVLGGSLIARPLIEAIYGAGYRAAAEPFTLLLVSFGLMVVSRCYRTLLIAFGHERVDFRIMAVSAAINVILNLCLIYPLGLTGAALATVASECAVLILGYLASCRYVHRMPLPWRLTPTLIGAAGLSLTLLLTRSLPLLFQVAAAGSVYLFCLVAMRLIHPTEVRALRQALGVRR
jgi:O-antigen/teichoic acid export membrane protein